MKHLDNFEVISKSNRILSEIDSIKHIVEDEGYIIESRMVDNERVHELRERFSDLIFISIDMFYNREENREIEEEDRPDIIRDPFFIEFVDRLDTIARDSECECGGAVERNQYNNRITVDTIMWTISNFPWNKTRLNLNR